MLEFDLWTIIFSVINILILFFFLKKFLFGRVDKMLAKRAAMVQEDLDAAKEKSEQADAMKAEYEATLKTARDEAKDIVDKANVRAQNHWNEVTEKANMEADAILKTAQKEIEQERAASLDDVRNEIADLAMSAAGKLLEQDVSDATNRALVDEFLAQEGETHE